jgi:DNA-binding transcriptional regulator YhcF (GntR family)
MSSNRAAITESLRQRIVAGLHLGSLRPGDRLPSLRDVGNELEADPRTVMTAYRQLAAEGLVRLRPRSGVFVQGPAQRGGDVLPEVAGFVVDVFMRGLSHGIAPTELRRQARACLDSAPVRAACLECNDDQTYALCEQVQEDYGFEAVAVDVGAAAARGALPPRAAAADLVLTTRFHVAEAERLGRRLRRPVLVATLDPAFTHEVTRMLAAGRVWWICTDPRFAAKLPTLFPGAALKPVVLGQECPNQIPAEDMVYATRRAAERLPSGWRGGRVITVPRVFSEETSRALLTFLVRRNLRAAREAAPRLQVGAPVVVRRRRAPGAVAVRRASR